MQIMPFCDYNFSAGERAQYVYYSSDDEEKTLMVHILDEQIGSEGKLYIISAHEKALNDVGVGSDEFLTNHYYTQLLPGHKAAYLDPDELIPAFRQLTIVVDNTRGKNNDSNDETCW